jgi:UDP-2,3-diacylglucosamine pyrophosphatase LpxH
MESYRSVFVVSDLHLGGYTGVFDPKTRDWGPVPPGTPVPKQGIRSFRIFRDALALGWAIDQAAAAPGPVALVLNGDIVDFLASPEAKGFDPDGARAKLEAIIKDPEQQEVWAALRRFVTAKVGDLVLVVGNHDVELIMSDARQYLIDYLTEGDDERAKRIVPCCDGQGFSCIVGGARVRAVHGNAVDPWNDVDYGRLKAYDDARRLRTRLPDFRVNAGSKLVVEHMNAVKRRYQWIDLLKPEQEGAALVSAALDKEHSAPIGLLLENLFTRGSELRRAIFVGETPEPRGAPTPGTAARAGTADPFDVDALLQAALDKDAAGVTATELVQPSADGMLSIREVLPAMAMMKVGRSLRETLLAHLPGDRSYDPFAGDDTYLGLDRTQEPQLDFLIAGHTHLERSLPRRNGPGHYFNSGTWIKLVQIPAEALQSDQAFEPVRLALEDGSIEALEQPITVGQRTFELVKSIRTVVRVEALENGGVSGALFHVEGAPAGFSMKKLGASERILFRGQR